MTRAANTAAVPPANGVVPVKISARPPALVAVRIPSRNQHTRDLVVRVYQENPHLQRADLWAVTRYAELSWKFRRLAELMERLPDGGFLRQDMEPRKVLGELRALSGELLRHEAALRLVASSKAALGVDVARMSTFAQQMQRAREES